MTNPQAYLINKYNYFKLRDVAYLLRNSTAEFEVGWEKSTNVITLTTGKNYTAVGGELNTKALSSVAGKPTTAIVKVNGKKVSFDGYIINGNNYYKIADMAAALGFTADYDVPSRTDFAQNTDTCTDSGFVHDRRVPRQCQFGADRAQRSGNRLF